MVVPNHELGPGEAIVLRTRSPDGSETKSRGRYEGLTVDVRGEVFITYVPVPGDGRVVTVGIGLITDIEVLPEGQE